MPDERVSIQATLEGNLAPELAKLSVAGDKISKSIVVADKDLNLFRHSLSAVAERIKAIESGPKLGASVVVADQNLAIFRHSLDSIANRIREVEKAEANTAVSANNLEVAHGRMAARSARVVQRLLSIQIAMQTLASQGPGSFGRYRAHVEAGTVAMGSFASIVSLFPNQFGLILGAVAAASAAISVFSKNAEEAKAKLAELKKQIADDRKEFFGKRGESFFEQVVGGDRELLKAKTGLEEVRKSAVAAFAAVEEARSRRNFLLKDRSPGLGAAEFDLEEASKNAQQFMASFIKLDQEVKTREGIAKLTEDARALEDELADIDRKLEVKMIEPLDAVREKARIAGEAVKGAFAFMKLVPTESSKQVVRDNIREQKEAQRVLSVELEHQNAEKEEMLNLEQLEEQRLHDIANAADDEGREMNEFYTGIAQGIGQAFASATGELIDGLVQGEINFREFAGQFLLQIAKMIAQAIVLKAVMAGLGLIGFKEGGEVPIKRASGGPIPGPNVNADVVPAMLTPGEFVMRKEAVQKYGRAVMHAMNRGLVPTSDVFGPEATAARNLSGHFAEGGEVPFGAGAVPKPAIAFVMASDGEADRFLSGGDGGLIRVMERNRSRIRSVLGIGGR